MDMFNRIFKDLVFTVVEEKQGYSIYGAGIASGLGGGTKRYILLFVPKHLALKRQARIHELAWQNLQTRELRGSYNLKQQRWAPPRDEQDILLEVVHRDKNSSTYRPVGNDSFPFEVLMLNDPKKKTSYQYRAKLTVISAIDMFNSVFNYTGNTSPLIFTSGSEQPPPPVNPISQNKINFGNHISIPEVPSMSNWFGGGSKSTSPNIVDDDAFEMI